MKICDLHTHSRYSDGKRMPSEIIDMAIDLGLSAVALCDHNTVDGLPDFLASAKNKNIQAIAGAEFSVDHNGKELHLLGLYIPERYFEKVADLMKEVNRKKYQSNIDLIRSLNQAGYEINYGDVEKHTPNGNVNRSNIGEELMRKGYTKSIDHAFKTLLDPKFGHYKEPERLRFLEMIDFIRSIGAVPVLAHPFLQLNQAELEVLLPLAKKRGLVGMECFYSEYDEATTEEALALAERFGLKRSGGSDFHGENKPHIKLGVGTGNLKIPYDWAVALKTAE